MIGLLLIGYNRINLTLSALSKSLNLQHYSDNLKIYVSLDGPKNREETRSSLDLINIEQIKKLIFSVNGQLFYHEFNLGVDTHIPWAIGRVLKECEGLIVIEDDIDFSEDAIASMILRLQSAILHNELEPILAMSGIGTIGIGPITIKSRWRTSRYFSAWGYALTRKFWQEHQKRLQKNYDIEGFLDKSINWNLLNNRKKEIWVERFSRENYDYQLQKTIFELGINTIAPSLRIMKNIGFSDAGATNTRYEVPKFMKYRSFEGQVKCENQITLLSRLLNSFLVWLDSNTWAGDGLLSRRGRRIGLRTWIKNKARTIISEKTMKNGTTEQS